MKIQFRLGVVPSLLFGLAMTSGVVAAQYVPLTQDSYVLPGSAGNYGVQQTFSVGGVNAYRGLVQFDRSTLPAGVASVNISKATLILFPKTVTGADAINISVANGFWTESGAKGNNSPAAGTAIASGVNVSNAGNYVFVDATAAVQSWITSPGTNHGFLITPADGTVDIAFDSKESATTSHLAELQISLASIGTAGATGSREPMVPRARQDLWG
jgi:hypothetical protein